MADRRDYPLDRYRLSHLRLSSIGRIAMFESNSLRTEAARRNAHVPVCPASLAAAFNGLVFAIFVGNKGQHDIGHSSHSRNGSI